MVWSVFSEKKNNVTQEKPYFAFFVGTRLTLRPKSAKKLRVILRSI